MIDVLACGVCRTDLHVCDGDLQEPRLPLIPGHEIVGIVTAVGAEVHGLQLGQRVGVPWLGSTCGDCFYCRQGPENLCPHARFTGYDIHSGYAEKACADARFCFPIPKIYNDSEAAPLLCAGLIGYRSYRMTENPHKLGIYGFGAAAHIVAQVAVARQSEIYAFTSPGDLSAQSFARSFGCTWAGASDRCSPVELDAAIILAPVGALVPTALKAVRRGGIVVCGGIHMSDIPQFGYSLLWGERVLRSVANLTRQDALEFLDLAPSIPIRTQVETFSLSNANLALQRLRSGALNGAAVLIPGG